MVWHGQGGPTLLTRRHSNNFQGKVSYGMVKYGLAKVTPAFSLDITALIFKVRYGMAWPRLLQPAEAVF